MQSDISLLATSNEELKAIYLWSIYSKPKCKENNKIPDRAYCAFHLPARYDVENMRWKNNSTTLLVSLRHESREDKHSIVYFDCNNYEEEVRSLRTMEQPDRSKLIKPKKISKQKAIKKKDVKPRLVITPMLMSYFCSDDNSNDILHASSGARMYSIDIRTKDEVNYYGRSGENSLQRTTDIMVDYNQKNYLIFTDCTNKQLMVFDMRRVI